MDFACALFRFSTGMKVFIFLLKGWTKLKLIRETNLKFEPTLPWGADWFSGPEKDEKFYKILLTLLKWTKSVSNRDFSFKRNKKNSNRKEKEN